ncbi:hypothetical protein PT300_09845 [Enterobacteriaceae bacterium ESL0689]|nr:hypothetical protein [Enterobacteriaceae bacterium ESL0689]
MAEFEKLLDSLVNLDGALGAALVDARNGMMLYGVGSVGLDIEIAAASITDVLRANIKMLKLMASTDEVEDILITLGKQYHIVRPVKAIDGIFVYTILDRHNGNLALARRKVTDVEESIVVL